VDEAAAIAALSEVAEEIGGIVRKRVDQDGIPSEKGGTQEDEEMSAAEKEELRLLRTEMQATTQSFHKMAKDVEAIKAAEGERGKREEQSRAAEIERRVEALIAEGKATDAMRADVVHMFTKAPAEAERIFGAAAKVVPIGEDQSGGESGKSKTEQGDDIRPHETVVIRNLISMGIKPDKAKARVIAMREQINEGAVKVGLHTA
jgi:hypothetical protein